MSKLKYGMVTLSLTGLNGMASEVYTVKKGDTLSEILFEKFRDQRPSIFIRPQYLQIVMKMNPDILNPHLIYPEQRILLPHNELIDHKIKKDDSLSKIFYQKQHLLPGIRLEEYLEEILASNKHIKDPDLIYPDQWLNLRVLNKFLVPNTKQYTQYQIVAGDTLSKLSRRLYGQSSSSSMVHQIKKINPHIMNIDFVEIGQVINLPKRVIYPKFVVQRPTRKKEIKKRAAQFKRTASRKKAAILAKQNKHGVLKFADTQPQPQRAPASVNPNPKFFTPTKELKDEIRKLSQDQAKKYIRSFKSILVLEDDPSVVGELKVVLEKSRSMRHENLEYSFLQLITSKLKSKTGDRYLADLRLFFDSWKRARRMAKN